MCIGVSLLLALSVIRVWDFLVSFGVPLLLALSVIRCITRNAPWWELEWEQWRQPLHKRNKMIYICIRLFGVLSFQIYGGSLSRPLYHPTPTTPISLHVCLLFLFSCATKLEGMRTNLGDGLTCRNKKIWFECFICP
jgi:hypothetical protein